MEQRDILKDQIEQLGRVLGRILASLIGLKSNDDVNLVVEETKAVFEKELDLNVAKLVNLKQQELTAYLKERNFHHSHLETLAEYLFEVGKTKYGLEKDSYLRQTINILHLTDEWANTISLIRMNKIHEIKQMLR